MSENILYHNDTSLLCVNENLIAKLCYFSPTMFMYRTMALVKNVII